MMTEDQRYYIGLHRLLMRIINRWSVLEAYDAVTEDDDIKALISITEEKMNDVGVEKCDCACHTVTNMLHMQACCDDGYIIDES